MSFTWNGIWQRRRGLQYRHGDNEMGTVRIRSGLVEIGGGVAKGLQMPTPLTQAHRSEGRDSVRRPPKRPQPPACRGCGIVLEDPERIYCGDCGPTYRAEAFESTATATAEKLAALRAEGRDPAHGGETGRKRAEAIGRRNREAAEWERANPGERELGEFRGRILPSAHDVPPGAMVEATELSRPYCATIRRGTKAPAALAGAQTTR